MHDDHIIILVSGLLIYKASAGSGKTFQLTRQYLEILFRDEKNYSAILAVTFTNKAAGELKERVLGELVNISNGDLSASKHFNYLSDVLKRPADILIPRAMRILLAILKDYSHFSIGTIDEFFQSILRSFARDLGISTAYQVELNSKNIILEGIERLISKASEDHEVFTWFLEAIGEKIEDGKAWRKFERELYDLGNEILKESLSFLIVDPQRNWFSSKDIRAFKKELKSNIGAFENRMKKLSELSSTALTNAGLEANDFVRKGTGPVAFLINLCHGKYDPGAKRNYIDDPDAWLTNKARTEIGDRALPLVNEYLNPYLKEAIGLFDQEYPRILLSSKLLKDLSKLGMISSLASEIIQISREKELFLISFTNPIISRLVQDNPAPFIYERTGKYFKHYMIDEFQDTSNMQWNNFLPLIKESLSSGGNGMLVGDAKQSIYRWRNSNWRLIDSIAESDLGVFNIDSKVLDTNFRSRESIIDFNNQFFSRAGGVVVQHIKNEIGEIPLDENSPLHSIEKIYDNVKQELGQKKRGGFVRVQISRKEIENDYPAHFSAFPSLIEDLQSKQAYRPNDIVFLVRTNREANQIIRYFIRYKKSSSARDDCKYDIVSAESLRLDTSPVIRTIIAFFSMESSPSNHSFLARFSIELLACKSEVLKPEEIASISSRSRDRILKTICLPDLDEIISHSLGLRYQEKIEYIITRLKLNLFSGSFPFILSFKEYFNSEFKQNSEPSLIEVNQWWDDTGRSLKLPMNENINAMRVMSIHKSKGLEFPVVILPDCNWDFDHQGFTSPTLWLNTSGTVFNKLPIIPVKYGKDLLGSPFSEHFILEKIQIYLDNLNLLYVALTRAIDHLHVFVAKPEKKRSYKVGDLIEEIVSPDENGLYEFGDQESNQTRSAIISDKVIENNTYPANFDFEKKLARTNRTPELQRGRIMHGILERINNVNDMDGVIQDMQKKQQLDTDTAESIKKQLIGFINRPELEMFFSGTGKVLNEQSFLLPKQGEFRADRIVMTDQKVFVLEYKTGKVQDSHQNQVKRYMKGLQMMGYEKVTGYLLYLDENQVIVI